MVSVADCLGQKPYQSIGPPGIRGVSRMFSAQISGLTPRWQADWKC